VDTKRKGNISKEEAINIAKSLWKEWNPCKFFNASKE